MNIIEKIKAPTPKKWRKIGNACLVAGSAFIPFLAYLDFPESVIISSFILTVIGKVFAECHTED